MRISRVIAVITASLISCFTISNTCFAINFDEKASDIQSRNAQIINELDFSSLKEGEYLSDYIDFSQIDFNQVYDYSDYDFKNRDYPVLIEEETLNNLYISSDASTMATTSSESESNNTITTADIVSVNNERNNASTVTGKINSSTDNDYFKISVRRHGVLQIKLTPPNNTCLGLYVYNESGNLIASSNNSSVVSRIISTITLKQQTSEIYYICVTPGYGANNYSNNSYSLGFEYVNKYSSVAGTSPTYPLSVNATHKSINSPVGYRTYNSGEYHTGIDFSCGNDAVYCIADGKVVETSNTDGNTLSGAGNYIIIETTSKDPMTNKPIFLRYMHLDSIESYIQDEVSVSKGTKLGIAGNTGTSDGTHLHLDANVIDKRDGPTIRANPTGIINILDWYSYTYTGNPY